MKFICLDHTYRVKKQLVHILHSFGDPGRPALRSERSLSYKPPYDYVCVYVMLLLLDALHIGSHTFWGLRQQVGVILVYIFRNPLRYYHFYE